MKDIWYAANETRIHVVVVRWESDVMVEKYYDSSGVFVPVEIYKPTVECIDSNPDVMVWYTYDIALYRGPKEGTYSD